MLGQARTTVSERRGAAAIGEEAEVADADEAVGHDVERHLQRKVREGPTVWVIEKVKTV